MHHPGMLLTSQLLLHGLELLDTMTVRISDVTDWRLPDDGFLASFRLPSKGEGSLAKKFPFPRELRISFDEGKHEYTIDGYMKAPRSATGLLR